jgi:hypothetical protein
VVEKKYSNVLQYLSLRLLTSMAVEKRRHLHLQQVDAKNAFCRGTLPANETKLSSLLLVILMLPQMNTGY